MIVRLLHRKKCAEVAGDFNAAGRLAATRAVAPGIRDPAVETSSVNGRFFILI